MSRSISQTFEQGCHDGPSILGSPFFVYSEERLDLYLTEAMRRSTSLVWDKARDAGVIAESAVLAIVDAVISFAVDMLKIGTCCERNGVSPEKHQNYR